MKAPTGEDARMADPPSDPDTGSTSQGSGTPPLGAGPQRHLLLTDKALVLAAAAAETRIAACLIFQAFLAADDAMRTTLADPGVLRASPGPAWTSRSWAPKGTPC